MKKAILFDLDGTLWDSSEAVCAAWNECMETFPDIPYRTTQEQMKSYMGLPMDVIAVRVFHTVSKERAMELLAVCESHENDYIDRHGGNLMPDLVEVLSALRERGHFLAVVSNCQEGYVKAFLDHHGMWDYFQDYEEYGRTGKLKAQNIRLVLERNGFKPEDAVYVGDTMGDYEASAEAGTSFLHAAYGFGQVPEGTPAIAALTELISDR